MTESAKVAKQIQHTARQLAIFILVTVLCGIVATVASVVYTSWSNDRQDANICKFLVVLERNSPPTPTPTNDQARVRAEAYAKFKRDIHCH